MCRINLTRTCHAKIYKLLRPAAMRKSLTYKLTYDGRNKETYCWQKKAAASEQKVKTSDGKHVMPFGWYSMALCRVESHAGAAAVVRMLGPGAIRGEFGWKGAVWRFEHMAAHAKRVRSQEYFP